jgi:hypothetical protein
MKKPYCLLAVIFKKVKGLGPSVNGKMILQPVQEKPFLWLRESEEAACNGEQRRDKEGRCHSMGHQDNFKFYFVGVLKSRFERLFVG